MEAHTDKQELRRSMQKKTCNGERGSAVMLAQQGQVCATTSTAIAVAHQNAKTKVGQR